MNQGLRNTFVRHSFAGLLWILMAYGIAMPSTANDLNEFTIKREAVFEFTEKPRVTHADTQFTIHFTSRAYCDVSIVIENGDGRIVRHLASGVLGENAPAPLQPNSLRQRILWDGKNDQDAYVREPMAHVVRVSLGLKPIYEKSLLWEPKVRMHKDAPGMAAAPEGVYVYDGRVLDHVRLFDHDGNYVRSVYPFPADQVKNVQGLHWRSFPEDGLQQPMKEGFHQATMLSSGLNSGFDPRLGIGIHRHNNYHGSVWGTASSMLAVRGVALLDSNGNLILRTGRCGNVDSAGADSRVPLGGDEVGLFYAPYVAVDTDRRLFIADAGNARIVSVKLNYHVDERVSVGDQ
jgi:hypothetical protein